ncbi:type I restriction endonuclease subunit R [Spirosoma fluminis]
MSQGPEFIQSEQPALLLLQRLGYQCLTGVTPSAERPDAGEVVLAGRLREAIKQLNPDLDANNQQRAYERITQVVATSLMEANQRVWDLLRGNEFTLKQNLNGRETFVPVRYINYDKPETNDFLVVNQMRFRGRTFTAIPDLVIYVNGLPLGIIECKAGSASGAWDSAWNDLDAYQRNNERLFHYNQICAGIWQVGGRYGAINTPQAFYSHFRADNDPDLNALLDGRTPTEQDILIYNLFRPDRLLDIIRHFVLFELDEGRTIKKLPRYQQVRAVNRTVTKLQQKKQGGVVWHTQGSGKSLTMAYLIRKLRAPEYGFDNPTILVLTDRNDLDQQITSTFQNIGFKGVQQASSVAHLDKLLRNDYGGIITTTLQKFQQTDKNATGDDKPDDDGFTRTDRHIVDNLLVQVHKALRDGKWTEVSREEIPLEVLSIKENLYVLVDEAHRSHYGFLAAFMRCVLPNAKFIAFTGTPISKEDKSTLAEFYGEDYLDVYTIKESVTDGATVELLYDAGIARLDVKKAELDAAFEAKFANEPEEKKSKLKDAALRKYQFSAGRIRDISKHLLTHYGDKIYPDGHKAILVCTGRQAALAYQQTILNLQREGFHNFKTRVVVSLGSAKSDPIMADHLERVAWNKENPNDSRPILITPPEKVKAVTDNFKLPFGNENELDSSGKKRKYDNTAILIVSDMLLTGYDAPIAGGLYLDKPLKEHNLLQAIARVNRTYRSKAAGFIVDYCGITSDLIKALEIFSGDVRPDDILRNLNDEIPKLELNHGKLLSFAKPIKLDRHYQRDAFIDTFIRYIEPIHLRDQFKELLKAFNKSIHIVLPNQAAMKYRSDFKLFNEIKLKARNAYPDDEELKVSTNESRMLQQLINDHLVAEGVQNLLAEPVSIIDREKFKADILNASPATKELKMRNQLKYTIRVGMDRNPDFFKPLAQRLDNLLKEHEAGRIDQVQLLIGFTQLQDDLINEQRAGQAQGFTSRQQIDVFNALTTLFNEHAAETTKQLFAGIDWELGVVGWEGKPDVRYAMEQKIGRLLKDKIPVFSDRQKKAKELIELLKKDKNA